MRISWHFSDEPLAETLDDLIALAASEETLTDPVVAPEDSHVADPVVAPEDSHAADPVVAPEDSPVMSAKCKLCPSCVDGR